MEIATFGAGCFWGTEAAFSQVPGVIATRVGYAGGTVPNPTYEEVCSGLTGHTEVAEVTYDPTKVSYDALLDVFWKHNDPTAHEKAQYRSVIFYHTPAQRDAAVESKQRLAQSGKYSLPIVTEILPRRRSTRPRSTISTSTRSAGSQHRPLRRVRHPLAAQPRRTTRPAVPLIRLFSVDKGGFVEMEPVVKTDAEWRHLLTKEQYEVTRKAGTKPPCQRLLEQPRARALPMRRLRQ